MPWLNQYSPGAWKYLIDLAKAAARAGVDEVQFDYVRFPSEGDLADMRFPHKRAEPMNATIPRFLAARAQGAQALPTSSSASTSSASPPTTISASARTSR